MVAASPLPSDEDLLRQLHALPDHLKGEIIEGELFVQPRPRFRHARAVLRSARPFKGAHMRFPFALAFGVLAASCAAPPESSTPMLSEGGEAREDSTPAERTGEAQDPWTRAQCQEAFVETSTSVILGRIIRRSATGCARPCSSLASL
jgi:hypothetical protein